jgi:glutamate racemase
MNNHTASTNIGVFDSGIGGLSVVHAIENAFPNDKVTFINDHLNVPYGTKSPELLLRLVTPLLQSLVKQGCDVIVIACNTVTTTIIDKLREDITVPIIGMEPMVRTAALRTKSGVIAVCATPTTLASNRYKWLKDTYANGLIVLEPDCSDWSLMIESDQIDKQKINNEIEDVCSQNADIIVLGCTHYHWIEDIITKKAARRAEILQPEQAVVTQLKRVIAQLP